MDGKQKFKKIKRISMVDQVSDSLQELIDSGVLKVGDKLPSEAELAESYSVNRLTVRMALQKLQTIGLIETRVGEGSFVKEVQLSDMFSEIPRAAFPKYSREEVAAFRKMLEMEAARCATASATPEGLELLRQYAEETTADPLSADKRAMERLDHVVAADLNFHRQLCACSHNALLLDTFNIFQRVIRENIISQIVMRENVVATERLSVSDEGVNIHFHLYQAISDKNWKQVKAICGRMLDYGVFVQEEP